MGRKRGSNGKTPLLSGESLDEFTRLWCETCTTRAEIVSILFAKFGVVITETQLEGQADRRQLRRDYYVPPKKTKPTMSELLTKSWLRWAGPRMDVDKTRITGERHPVPEGGYRMGGS